MGDESNCLAFLLQIHHNLHQLIDFLRSQNGGGLVKDQNTVVSVEHLQDLDTLLHTNGDICNLGIAVDVQAVLLAQGHNLLTGLLHLQHAVLGGFNTQHNVFQNGKVLDQHKVLVHHADTQRICGSGISDIHLLAVQQDLTLFRLVQTKQHAHQRGFACAVFAQQCVDLAFLDAEGHIIICDDAGEHLGDVPHFNGKF